MDHLLLSVRRFPWAVTRPQPPTLPEGIQEAADRVPHTANGSTAGSPGSHGHRPRRLPGLLRGVSPLSLPQVEPGQAEPDQGTVLSAGDAKAVAGNRLGK